MQRVEDFRLRGMRDEARAERRYAAAKGRAEDVARLHQAAAGGKVHDIYRLPRRPSRENPRPARRHVPAAAGGTGERRISRAEAERGNLPEGTYRLDDGSLLCVGERACADNLRERRRRYLEADGKRLVEAAVQTHTGRPLWRS